jgi:hypothetical protein
VKLAGKPYEVHLLAVIVLYVLGFAVYLNSFSAPFVFDDYPNIRDNPSIRLTAIDIEGLRDFRMRPREAPPGGAHTGSRPWPRGYSPWAAGKSPPAWRWSSSSSSTSSFGIRKKRGPA